MLRNFSNSNHSPLNVSSILQVMILVIQTTL